MTDQKSGRRRAAVDSEQKNADQISIRRRSSQRSVIKPKNKLSSNLAEITKEDEQSINTNAAILSVYSKDVPLAKNPSTGTAQQRLF